MTKRSKSEPRVYRSEVREEQAAVTTERILAAVERRLSAGDRELSYTALAREARVSVPTVYRHFPTRHDLFQAVFLRMEPRAANGAAGFTDLRDPQALRETLRQVFRRFAADPVAGAGRLNTMWEFSRAVTVPSRKAAFERAVAERCPGLAEPERTWLVDIGVVLFSSAMAEALRGYLDLSADEAADRVAFALESLFAAHPPEET